LARVTMERDIIHPTDEDLSAWTPVAWVGNFTYIATGEGWLFLAVVIDLFSRKVVGWSMRPDMQRNLVIETLEMAWLGATQTRMLG
jgi:putative transposase